MDYVFTPGTKLDDYTVGEKFHTGGMAVIYDVTGPNLEFPCVMKVPRLGHGEPSTSVISFEVEETILTVLKGRHVPRYVGSGDMAKQPYLVMELVEGKSLQSWADNSPLADLGELTLLGAAVARALHSIHKQDVVHLDLKPGNVIIRPDSTAVLIDFGLAHHSHYPDLLAEEWRKPIGSAPYIAPEQVLGQRCDPRSDIFALGVILYELATGRLPFGAPTSTSGLKKRFWADPVPPKSLVKELPDWLQEIIMKCMEPALEERYQSAAQVAFDLTHPDHVVLTDRGTRVKASGVFTRLRKWFRAAGFETENCAAQPQTYLEGAPIVLVAVATTHENPEMDHALRDVVKRLFRLDSQTRFSFLSIISPISEVGGAGDEDHATGQQIKHRVRLRNWAEQLHLSLDRISLHVIESDDAAGALLDYARNNNVNHVVIGSPPLRVARRGRLGLAPVVLMSDKATEPLPLIQLMGTVSMRVAAAAPCTVTVVRVPERS